MAEKYRVYVTDITSLEWKECAEVSTLEELWSTIKIERAFYDMCQVDCRFMLEKSDTTELML